MILTGKTLSTVRVAGDEPSEMWDIGGRRGIRPYVTHPPHIPALAGGQRGADHGESWSGYF